MSRPLLYLASASPRRLSLLRQIGLDPVRVLPRIEELARPRESPRQHVSRLAEAKARRVAPEIVASRAPGLILAADTEVVVDDTVLGKPRNAAEAREMLGRLRGRTHEVLTAVFLLRTDDGRTSGGLECTRVRFRDYDDETIHAYVATGEPLDKAGAYGIQGRGVLLVAAIEGSWSNVVGLPLERLPEWLERVGIPLRLLLDA